jgi:hypothetical protein
MSAIFIEESIDGVAAKLDVEEGDIFIESEELNNEFVTCLAI